MVPNLTKSELEQSRCARELCEWADSILSKFGETAEGKGAMRLQSKPYLKQFCEEIWPLANYARLFFWERSDVRFQPVIGNQSYDALLVDESGSTLCRFEITQALYGEEVGHQDRLRREHLDQYGHAPAPLSGAHLERDPDSRGIKESWPHELTSHTDAVNATIRQIGDAIEAKATKHYSPDTALIVEFEGGYLWAVEAGAELDAAAKLTLCALASGFSELALIDNRPGFGFRYPTPGKYAAS